MKILRFLKFIPVIAYTTFFGICQQSVNYASSNPHYPDWMLPVGLISFLLSVAVIIWHLVNCILGKYSGKETTIYTLLLMLIPIYPALMLVALGLVGLIVPIFGWMVSTVVIAYMYSIVVMTGVIQIGAIICLLKEGRISVGAAVVCGIFSFFFVGDIIVCIYLIVKAFRKRKVASFEGSF